MKFRKFTKKAMIAALLAGAMLTAGIALAAWIASGNGSAYSQAGTAVDLSTNDASASTVGNLYPDNTGTLVIDIHNPNPYGVSVDSITADVGSVTADAGHATCVNTDVSLNATAISTYLGVTPIAVAANGDSGPVSIADGAQMG